MNLAELTKEVLALKKQVAEMQTVTHAANIKLARAKFGSKVDQFADSHAVMNQLANADELAGYVPGGA